MTSRVSVSSADFIRNIGYWQNEALRRPISITHHGRERLILASPDAFRGSGDGPHDAAEMLAPLRADLAAVQENVEDGLLIFDAGLRVRGSNCVAETFAGIARAELIGANLADVLAEPFASILSDRIRRVIRTRHTERFEIGVSDGRYLALTVFPVSAGAAALMRNVTEERALRQQVEECGALDEVVRRCSRAAMMKLDARARIEAVDETFTAWFGFEASDVAGHRVVELVAASQRREAGELVDGVLREGKPCEMEIKLVGRRGEEIAGLLAVAPILTDFAAHGAFGLFISSGAADSTRQAAA